MKLKNHLLFLTMLLLTGPRLVSGQILDDYIAAPDPNYHYRLVNTIEAKGYTAYVLEMTSQSWRQPAEVDRTLWRHWLTIIKPDRIDSDKALLWIGGGNNGGSAPRRPDAMMTTIAVNTKSVVADLKMVPNQPLTFPDGGRPRYEDAIIAYSFQKYVTTQDKNWPALLPMVKSAVRAMDTVHSHLLSVSEGELNIKKFVVTGASKRGWTTWLTAVADPRVIAVMPLVIDVLNMDEQMKHHFNAYGFYSQAIQDYVDLKIFDNFDTPEGKELIKIVDPYEYLDRLAMPKYLINASGDQFFLPDSAQFYFKDLKGENYLRYIPNTDHSLRGSDAQASLLTFYRSILSGSPRPKFSWQIEEDGSIVVRTQQKPTKVNLWQATNPKTRDFRLQTIGPAWKSSALSPQTEGVYIAKPPALSKGWTAFFVELIFDNAPSTPFKFTTQVNVISNKTPSDNFK